jgi:hypothetical protein
MELRINTSHSFGGFTFNNRVSAVVLLRSTLYGSSGNYAANGDSVFYTSGKTGFG